MQPGGEGRRPGRDAEMEELRNALRQLNRRLELLEQRGR
jgi:hypothetical protein